MADHLTRAEESWGLALAEAAALVRALETPDQSAPSKAALLVSLDRLVVAVREIEPIR